MALPKDTPAGKSHAAAGIFGSSILSNLAWSTFHILLSKGIRFGIVAFCIRRLGTYSWGQIAATFVTVAFLSFAVDQGLGAAPIVHQVGNRALDRILLSRISAYRLFMAMVVTLVLRLADRFIHPIDHLVIIYSLALLPRALNLDWWFQRREIFHVTTALATVRVVAFSAAALLLLKGGDRPETVLYLEFASEALAVAVGYGILRRYSRFDKADQGNADVTEGPGFLQLAKMGFPFLVIGILNTIHQSVDILFLKYMCGHKAVGEYDVGYRIGFFFFFAGAAVVQSVRPKLARLHAEGSPETISDILESCSKILAALGCAFLIGSLYFSDALIAFIFNTRGGLSSFVFQWAPVWVGTAFMTILTADTLICLGERGKYLRGAFYCATTNIVGNFTLIKMFGAHGSIFATILAETVFLGYTFAQLPRIIRGRLLGSLVPQGTVILVIVAGFLLSSHWRYPVFFFTGSLAVLASLVIKQGTLRKSNLAVLSRN